MPALVGGSSNLGLTSTICLDFVILENSLATFTEQTPPMRTIHEYPKASAPRLARAVAPKTNSGSGVVGLTRKKADEEIAPRPQKTSPMRVAPIETRLELVRIFHHGY